MVNLSQLYVIQPTPEGLAHAFILGSEFIGNDSCALVLADNLFYGHDLEPLLCKAVEKNQGATVFAHSVSDPERYAVTSLYLYDSQVVEIAQSIRSSKRGELEITDMNRIFLEQKQLSVEILGRGMAWLDTGTHEALLEASQFIQTIENRQGFKVTCLEEIAWRKSWISDENLKQLSIPLRNYSAYLI